ncbi:cytochrome P450 family 24 subfamily A member shade isoform X1 [Neodiprion pinetum]|uniref:Ecdysone 20-monooxygenase isoform X1 n=2 Tax=Neodiprion lecontei TaxID=441921 RepID=A0A6J0BSA3_NEOLC|nr:ecdysone 20-monooxygenase isoform X1 [Neodiprion lecontei]XP_046480258.1 ecdysone 20-monooxygenase isoform X1 [Neodiprion pinetum]
MCMYPCLRYAHIYPRVRSSKLIHHATPRTPMPGTPATPSPTLPDIANVTKQLTPAGRLAVPGSSGFIHPPEDTGHGILRLVVPSLPGFMLILNLFAWIAAWFLPKNFCILCRGLVSQFGMVLSGAWFEVVAFFAVLLLATRCRPTWWFSTGSSMPTSPVSSPEGLKRRKTLRDVPGPIGLPVLGTRWIYTFLGSYRMSKIHDAYKDLHRRYGSVCKEEALWNWPVVSVFAKKDIEAILRRSSRYPLRPPSEVISYYRQSRPDRYTNLGLVNEQGEVWHKLRSALTPELMSATTVLGFLPALNQVTDEFVNLIRQQRDTKHNCVTGFEELAYRLGLESTCTLILGRRLGFLEPDTGALTARLADAVRIHFRASRDAFYGLPLWKLVATKAYAELVSSEDAIYDTISELLDNTSSDQLDDANDDSVEAVFKSILRDKNLDMRDKKAAIVDFIAAGIHTLGNTLVFLIDLIGRHKEVQRCLHEEVSALAPPGCSLAAEDLRDAKYLRACIFEAYRVLPTTPCIARILEEPMELGGYDIKSGTVVLCQTWIAGLEEENFRDADKFMPERWLKTVVPHSPLLVAPFGSGRRICPGKRFVDQALQLILAQMVREFNISVTEDLELQFEFIIAPKPPVKICFEDRLIAN